MTQKNNKTTYKDSLWGDIVHHTLKNAIHMGLGTESLLRAADTLDIPHAVVLSRCQNPKIDIIRMWGDILDLELYTHVQNIPANARIRDKIAELVKYRIQQMTPYKTVVQEAFALFSLPQNGGFATHHIWDTAHHMWTAIGDTTAPNDHNYYSKRLILSGVIFTTIAFWLQDDSNTATTAYIDRRITDALRLGKIKNPKNLAKFTQYMPFMDHPLKMRD